MDKEVKACKLELLDWELERLRFRHFDCDSAYVIGQYLINKGKSDHLPIAVDIQYGDHQMFHIALAGSNEENDLWIKRKNKVALHFKKSSYYIRVLLEEEMTIEEKYDLDSKDYAAFGGAFPIMGSEGLTLGTITVSGLEDHEDHMMVVDAISYYLDQN